MAAEFKSKHGIVARQPAELYMGFCDMRNFKEMLPSDKKEGVSADFDSISANVQGMNIGVRVTERNPYSLIALQDDGAPFHFSLNLHFDAADNGCTDFSIDADADLNFMMKSMLGGKITEALNKIVDSLVDVSEGRMPEGFDPNNFPGKA